MQTAYRERRAAHTCESIIDGSLTLDLHPSVAKENTNEISNHVRGMAKGKEQDGTGAGFEMGMPRHKTTPGKRLITDQSICLQDGMRARLGTRLRSSSPPCRLGPSGVQR